MGGLVGKSDWGAAGRPRKGSAGVEGGIPNVKLAVLPCSVVSLGSFSTECSILFHPQSWAPAQPSPTCSHCHPHNLLAWALQLEAPSHLLDKGQAILPHFNRGS